VLPSNETQDQRSADSGNIIFERVEKLFLSPWVSRFGKLVEGRFGMLSRPLNVRRFSQSGISWLV
jgi:hypothetical protein